MGKLSVRRVDVYTFTNRVGLAVLCLLTSLPAMHIDSIYFDDSASNVIVVGNADLYEVGFQKSNGSIAYITDKTTGQRMTQGSLRECLWGAVLPTGTPDFVGGCSYGSDDAPSRGFSYTWSAATRTLTFDYTDTSSTQRMTAQVTVTVSENSWFDMQLQLQNDWGYVLDRVNFPSTLLFIESDIEEVLLPVLPGVVLKPTFFELIEQNEGFGAAYPTDLFADYISLYSNKGRIAIYTLLEPTFIHPSVVEIVREGSDSIYVNHFFGLRINDGDSWTSPFVRIRISQSHIDTIGSYRVDNELDGLPSLTDKLSLSFYDQLVQAPVLKLDATQIGETKFSQYDEEIFSRTPSPGLLVLIAYQEGKLDNDNFDENHPDFLPPDPDFGTTAEFASMFRQAQERGFLVMPFTNPTWWDDESPTLQNLAPPLTFEDIVVITDTGQTFYEYYQQKGGYVMSPYAPFVQNRLAQLMQEMTIDIPSDLIFEDQIGARRWMYDYNSSSPTPTSYIQGWFEHTQTYSDRRLMTELGFDRLAETEIGFHGSVLWHQREGRTNEWWGDNNWSAYPMASMMLRDKVILYQHLSDKVSTKDEETLIWNLAFGYMLGFDLHAGGIDDAWLDIVSGLQKHVLARYANERVTDLTDIAVQVTNTAFETFSVIVNWDKAMTYTVGQHTLSPEGFLVESDDNTLIAGNFTKFNGMQLNTGDHYLIEERHANHITVYQLFGSDTDLTLDWLPSWTQDESTNVLAYSTNGQVIGSIPATIMNQKVTFTYQMQLNGQPVSHYVVRRSTLFSLYLPVVRNRR